MQQPAPRASNSPEFSTAYHFLDGLNEIGIEYLFCNFGTDHAPIIEEMAHKKKLGEKMPMVIRCPHENTAGHMAGGYAFMTGRGQGVLVHVDVGTANTANSMHNIFRTRLPVLLMADPAELDRILARGAEKARSVANPVLAEVYETVGFLPST